MDPSAVNGNLTVDDFDSVISYANQSVWTTPDPSSSSFNATASPWFMGTFHLTDTLSAELSFNFTGPAIFIYGHSGPAYGSYQVQIDSESSILSAYAPSNASLPYLLYGTSNLTYASHSLVLRNLGKQNTDAGGNSFLFDWLQTTVQFGPSGATLKNITVQESDPSLAYQGIWNSNTSPNFSGGGSSFTQADHASVSLNFNGSAIYVFGDKKNDHGLYNVYLDNGTAETFNGISGCGGVFGQTCEQQQPTLAYFASNLGSAEHSLKIENLAGVNQSFFDLDSIVITIPSEYAPRNLTGSSVSPASPTVTNAVNSALSAESLSNPLIFLVLAMMWLFNYW